MQQRKLDERARATRELGASRGSPADKRSRGRARRRTRLLARIALARHDARWRARGEAELAQQADPKLPLAGLRRRAAALRPGQVRRRGCRSSSRRSPSCKKPGRVADRRAALLLPATRWARLERYPEAESAVHRGAPDFPAEHPRPRRAGDAVSGDRAGRTRRRAPIGDMMRLTPTPESSRWRRGCGPCSETDSRLMPSARKRDARSPKPSAGSRPAHAQRDTDESNAAKPTAELAEVAEIRFLARSAVHRRGRLGGVGGRLSVASRPSGAGRSPADRRIRTSCSSPSTRCARMRSARYGGPAATPALDRLAGEGVRFEFAHAHAVADAAVARQHPHRPVPVPARHPRQQRLSPALRRADDGDAAEARRVRDGRVRRRVPGPFALRSERGFDAYDDHFGETRAPSEFIMPERPASVVVPLARRVDRGTRRRARDSGFGIRDSTKPWFVWVHVFDPHAPYRPPAPFDAQYASRPHYGEVAATDAALAPLPRRRPRRSLA